MRLLGLKITWVAVEGTLVCSWVGSPHEKLVGVRSDVTCLCFHAGTMRCCFLPFFRVAFWVGLGSRRKNTAFGFACLGWSRLAHFESSIKNKTIPVWRALDITRWFPVVVVASVGKPRHKRGLANALQRGGNRAPSWSSPKCGN